MNRSVTKRSRKRNRRLVAEVKFGLYDLAAGASDVRLDNCTPAEFIKEYVRLPTGRCSDSIVTVGRPPLFYLFPAGGGDAAGCRSQSRPVAEAPGNDKRRGSSSWFCEQIISWHQRKQVNHKTSKTDSKSQTTRSGYITCLPARYKKDRRKTSEAFQNIMWKSASLSL